MLHAIGRKGCYLAALSSGLTPGSHENYKRALLSSNFHLVAFRFARLGRFVAGKEEEEFPGDWFWEIIREKPLDLGVIKPNACIRSYPPVVCWIRYHSDSGRLVGRPLFPSRFVTARAPSFVPTVIGSHLRHR
jgi:hypothetical protein